ncbi:MAG: ACT domain-containing protein [Thermodesulfobacteriota bacterium]|nr:ACT domain-containing protein [Thermodesulfobacteriota bacterium]
MKVEQISIFLENRPGTLRDVTKVLGNAAVNIRSLSLADTTDFGILRIIVDNVDATKKILHDKGIAAGINIVVAVEVPDRPGGLDKILERLCQEEIGVEYMYAFVEKSKGNAVMIFRFDSTDRAIDVLTAAGFTVLTGEEVYSL